MYWVTSKISGGSSGILPTVHSCAVGRNMYHSIAMPVACIHPHPCVFGVCAWAIHTESSASKCGFTLPVTVKSSTDNPSYLLTLLIQFFSLYCRLSFISLYTMAFLVHSFIWISPALPLISRFFQEVLGTTGVCLVSQMSHFPPSVSTCVNVQSLVDKPN